MRRRARSYRNKVPFQTVTEDALAWLILINPWENDGDSSRRRHGTETTGSDERTWEPDSTRSDGVWRPTSRRSDGRADVRRDAPPPPSKFMRVWDPAFSKKQILRPVLFIYLFFSMTVFLMKPVSYKEHLKMVETWKANLLFVIINQDFQTLMRSDRIWRRDLKRPKQTWEMFSFTHC